MPPKRLTSLPVGLTMRAAHQSAANFGGAEIVKPGELIEVRYPKGNGPSLAARKIVNLLIGRAAGEAWRAGELSIAKVELRPSLHESNDRLEAYLDEISTTVVRFDWTTPDGQSARATVPLLIFRADEASEDGAVWFEFHPKVRQLLKASNRFASLHRATVLAFESKYALSLYELGTTRYERHDPHWEGTPNDLREMLGVERGRYSNWADFRRFVLNQAAAEINHLAPFTVTIPPDGIRRHGRKVIGLRLAFWRKDDAGLQAATQELRRPRVGRKARRRGKVETLVNGELTITNDESAIVYDGAHKQGEE